MMYHLSALSVCIQLALLVHMGRGESCVQNGEFDFRPDTQNCSVFYRCVGTTLNTFTCLANTLFSAQLKVSVSVDYKDALSFFCINQGSVNPICQTTTDTLIPHRTKCSLYYNCTAPARRYGWELNLQECDHPQVYNSTTQRCEHYSVVDCGIRNVPMGLCEYEYSKCRSAHCRPCIS